MRLARTAPLLGAAALTLSACGSSAPRLSGPPVTQLVSTAPSGTLRRLPGRAVGATQRVPATGTTLVVDVTKVIDPLEGSGARVPAGMVPVGVVIDVRNAGPSGYDSSATSDFSLHTAAGRAMPVFAPSGACQTYIQDFMNELGVGQSRAGCIAYVVPRADPPTTVTLAPDGGTARSTATWLVQ